MSFSPIIRVRKLLDKMKSERGEQRSPRLHNKRFHRTVDDLNTSQTYSPNLRPKKSAKSFASFQSYSGNEDQQEVVGEDQFMNLPIEATLLIFSFLEHEDLDTICPVSKLWNELSNDESLWKLLCVQDYNISTLHEKNWKINYRRIEEILSDGIWEGHSKWIEPAGFDNEQRTTARLCFQKRTSRMQPSNLNGGLSSPMGSPSVSSKAEIHRCASTTNPTQLTTMASNAITSSQTNNSSNDATSNTSSSAPTPAPKEVELKVFGSGVTVNCAAPSPFKIEGERAVSDTTGTTFVWNKLFERHTSLYTGKINFVEGTVCGTINYNDGTTKWRGEFYYKKMNRTKKVNHLNA